MAPQLPNPPISLLRFENFKGLRDVTVKVQSRFSLLIGRNACGKSSVLQGTYLFTQLFNPELKSERQYGRFNAVFTGNNSADRLMNRGAGSMGLGLEKRNDAWWMVASPTNEWDGHFKLNKAGKGSLGGRPTLALTIDTIEMINDAQLNRPGWDSGGVLSSAALLNLSARNAAKVSEPQEKEPQLGEDGSGLSSVLNWLAANEPDARSEIEKNLRAIVPGAKRFRTPNEQVVHTLVDDFFVDTPAKARVSTRRTWGHALEVEFDGAGWLSADLLSEGTLIVLALLAVVYSPSCPRLILLDDIDKALHPSAQVEVVKAIRHLLELKPDVQIIATAHSPYLLDQFDAEAVTVLSRNPTGDVRAALLSEHPDFEKWKGKLGTGEFWSTVGEDWVFGVAKE